MRPTYEVICIDDDEQFIGSLARFLPGKVGALCPGFECPFEFVTSVEELQEVLPGRDGPPLAVLISDQVMTGTTGIELIERIKAAHPGVLCVLLTGKVAIDSVKYAVNRHLLDQYVAKPIEDIDAFAAMVASLLKRFHTDREERQRAEQLARTILQLHALNSRFGAMLAATEQVALLAMDLKNLESSQVARTALRGAARLFKARHGAILLPLGSGAAPEMFRQQCPCADADLLRLAGRMGDTRDVLVKPGAAAGVEPCPVCEFPLLRVPLALRNELGCQDQERQQHGCLCLCGVDPEVAVGEPLHQHAALVRDIVTASLDNARLFEHVKHDSEIDYLTGAKTRRYFHAMLEAEHDQAIRYGQPFCVIIIDVDQFKDVNDCSGHAAGDKVLQALAALLVREKRSSDVLARYGGDEFAILTPHTDLRGAVDLAHRLRAQVFENLMVAGRRITISCGVAGWSAKPKADAIADVVRRADAAAYEAKAQGRNCVRTVSCLPSRGPGSHRLMSQRSAGARQRGQ